MAKLLAGRLKKVLIALRLKPRRAVNGISDLKVSPDVASNGVEHEVDEKTEPRCDEEGVTNDEPERTSETVVVDGEVEATQPEENGHVERTLEGRDDESHEKEVEEKLEEEELHVTAEETTRLRKLQERAKRFSIPFVHTRRSSTKSGKGKEKAAVVENTVDNTPEIVVEEEEEPARWTGMSLAELPFDVLFTLMTVADIESVQNLALTCKLLRTVSQSPPLWINHTISLQRRSRILALDDLVHPHSLHSSLPDLKRMVSRTDFLERNWRSPHPRAISPSLPHPGQPGRFSQKFPIIKLDLNMNTMLFAGSFFISEQFFLLSTVDGDLVAWDVSNVNKVDEEGRIVARNLGKYVMAEPFGLFTLRMHHAERSIYSIVCGRNDIPGYFVYDILKLQFPPYPNPEEPTSEKMIPSVVATYNVPSVWRIKTQNIDYLRRRICMLYQLPDDDDNELHMYMLLDWDTGVHVEVNTGLHRVSRESGMGLRFQIAGDGDSVHVYVMTNSLWIQKTYTIDSLYDLHRRVYAPTLSSAPLPLPSTSSSDDQQQQQQPETLPLTPWQQRYRTFRSDQTLAPQCTIQEELEMPSFVSNPHAELYQYWNLSQWWLRYSLTEHGIDVPTRFSRIFFYYMHPHRVLNTPNTHNENPNPNGVVEEEEEDDDDDDDDASLSDEEVDRQRKKAWHLVQYYTTSERPLSRKVFVCPLYDCPTIRLGALGFPIMGASFNHCAWIENTTVTVPVPNTMEGQSISGSLGSASGSRKLPWRKDKEIASSAATAKEEEKVQTRTKRVLRLVSFPEPGVSPDSEFTLRSLPERVPQMRDLDDVPESVLDKAIHIFLEPALGAVLITTSDNEMHRYNYA
ncbi:hypothetical protein SCHPADRAFT_932612 [Schizopora paradoxa]|uniref:F-box domain-containing protein n=1 Tax=Schizopora paradoxa TaxID=27342 RepID=A0A0H2RQT5_9AGAM|nr:hypothetical protein SCHPADRAFT_932612 [Schizopora paradoxa]